LSQPLLESIFDPHSIGHDGPRSLMKTASFNLGVTSRCLSTRKSPANSVFVIQRLLVFPSVPMPCALLYPRSGERSLCREGNDSMHYQLCRNSEKFSKASMQRGYRRHERDPFPNGSGKIPERRPLPFFWPPYCGLFSGINGNPSVGILWSPSSTET
jgi:hypothetical protein